VSTFVEECRREWRRLGVPDLIAEEMATDLSADLEEAEAEGVAAEHLLGGGATDPRRFAADWAQARGVVTGQPETFRRRPWVIAAVVTIVLVGGAATAIALLAGGQTTPKTITAPAVPAVQKPTTVSATVPNVIGQTETDAIAATQAAGFRVTAVLVWPTSRRSGTVISQVPAPGTVTARGVTLRLRIAGQPPANTKTQP
jgi:hypothetical protein